MNAPIQPTKFGVFHVRGVYELSILQLEQQGQVAYVWLNRPELHNAFNTTVIEELHTCFKQINTRDDIRVVVLAGRGKAFQQVPTSTG